MCALKLSKMILSETSEPILFEASLGWGKAARGFGHIGTELWFPWQQITDSSQRIMIGGNVVNTLYLIFFILAGNEDNHKISGIFEIWPNLTTDCGVRGSEKHSINL